MNSGQQHPWDESIELEGEYPGIDLEVLEQTLARRSWGKRCEAPDANVLSLFISPAQVTG